MAGEPAHKTVRLRIFGRVQGVGYRAWTAHKAKKLGLAGWVRNLNDGTVECEVQGAREAIEALVAACHAGPPIARVTQVNAEDVSGADVYSGFQQRPTADP
ncbi:MAG: acylphosphatase [Proteobacteria bacterium]|nr:acylphosphatase [Pseudomonadota bacterium]